MIDLRAPVTEIESNSYILGGEVVFKGTRLPVMHIGKAYVVAGVPMDVILEDYPYLGSHDVLAAAFFCASSEVLQDIMLENGCIDVEKWATP